MSACPNCDVRRKTQVLSSNLLANGWTKRRRQCTWGCGHRWFTYELSDAELDLSERDRSELLIVSKEPHEPTA